MERIGLIAGSGQFPIIFSREATAQGYAVYVVAHRNETDPVIEEHVAAVEWIHLGQFKRALRFFKLNQITQTVMMGAIDKTRIFRDVRPDTKAIALAVKMLHTHDDNLLSTVAEVLEDEGIRVRSSTFLLPHLLAPKGCWTRRKPSKSETDDIAVGWRRAKAIGALDIGQCVVVGGGSVLAVEAIEGTDATIRRGGDFSRGGAVVVKVCKPQQDTRFDVPAIGVQTILTMRDAGATALALEAGKAVVFDREEMVALADRHGISIIALSDGEMAG